MNNLPIGVFDSGIGGLTVLKGLIKEFPRESFIYLGDTARVPYGTRDKETIMAFSRELVDFLLKKNVKTLVVACNTMSAVSLGEIKKMSRVPVVDVIGPTVKYVVKNFKDKKIGVIGTRGTINSKAYETLFNKSDVHVESRACPLFVSLAEEGMHNSRATEIIAREYLHDLNVECLVLGCTHYPILEKVIRKVVGPRVKLVNSAGPTANALGKLLSQEEILSDTKNSESKFYVTDDTQRTEEVARLFFGKPLILQKVKI